MAHVSGVVVAYDLEDEEIVARPSGEDDVIKLLNLFKQNGEPITREEFEANMPAQLSIASMICRAVYEGAILADEKNDKFMFSKN